MAKIKQKSKNEAKKKASKAATVKCRIPTTQKKKPAGRVSVKTTAEIKAARNSSSTKKVSSKKVEKTATKKTTVARTTAVKKATSRAKTALPIKRTVTKPRVSRPTQTTKSVTAVHPLERKQASTQELRMMLLEKRNGILKNFDDEIATTEEYLKPVVVGDVADLAQGSSENELTFRLAEVESRELGKIDKALEKINAGTYGVCEKCGEPISQVRLKALPFASKCIRCQEEDERNNY